MFTLCMIVGYFYLVFLSLSLSFFDRRCIVLTHHFYLCTGNLLIFYSSFTYRVMVPSPKCYFPQHYLPVQQTFLRTNHKIHYFGKVGTNQKIKVDLQKPKQCVHSINPTSQIINKKYQLCFVTIVHHTCSSKCSNIYPIRVGIICL